MSCHPLHLLRQWFPQKDARQWVLGTVFRTQGSAYRKAGALMLFNDLGQQFGLLSGGCLESDLQRHAQKVLLSDKAVRLEYNSHDESDVSYLLGIGCGGVVEVLLQPLSQDNDYLGLDRVLQRLEQGLDATLVLAIEEGQGSAHWLAPEEFPPFKLPEGTALVGYQDKQYLCNRLGPPPHLALFGGGVDAQPLVAMAANLGWQLSLVDPRPSHARPSLFTTASRIARCRPAEVVEGDWWNTVTAAVVMTHNLELDAEALGVLAHHPHLKYCALLGPTHRREEALELAGQLPWQGTCSLAGPAGLYLGAELPEGIALSILAECHAALHGGHGQSISGVLGKPRGET